MIDRSVAEERVRRFPWPAKMKKHRLVTLRQNGLTSYTAAVASDQGCASSTAETPERAVANAVSICILHFNPQAEAEALIRQLHLSS